ncbi:hypothetical protein [Shimia ponticola]|uniref:hypothetical protein n=1 Tax=Shimia ponticola TaxID=2582893 RepID=UPI0011BEEC46|nr:hypothetical protein [Shimia ponticola]
MIAVKPPIGSIANLEVSKAGFPGSAFTGMVDIVRSLVASGHPAILIDISALGRIRASEIAALLELAARALPDAFLGVYGGQPAVRQRLADVGADRVVRSFVSLERALSHPAFRRHRLSGVSAVVLCPEASAMNAISPSGTAAMSDVMGRPVLEHGLNFSAGFGVRHVSILAAEADVHSIAARFGNGGRKHQNLFYASVEGHLNPLVQHAKQFGGFRETTVVLLGDALLDCDLPAIVDAHQQSGCDVTTLTLKSIGKSLAQSTSDPTIAVVSPNAGQALRDMAGQDIGFNCWRELERMGCSVRGVTQYGHQLSVMHPQSYFAAWSAAMAGRFPTLDPAATEIEAGLWVQANTRLPRRLDRSGPLYLGAGARVTRNSRLKGVNVLLPNAACSGAHMTNSLLLPGVTASKTAWVDSMIASDDWAIHHPIATQAARPGPPLEGVDGGAQHGVPSEIAKAG